MIFMRFFGGTIYVRSLVVTWSPAIFFGGTIYVRVTCTIYVRVTCRALRRSLVVILCLTFQRLPGQHMPWCQRFYGSSTTR
jgi:hypothetical protein